MTIPMVAVRRHYDKTKSVEYKPGETFQAEDDAAAARLVRLKRAVHAPPPPAPKVVTRAMKADPPVAIWPPLDDAPPVAETPPAPPDAVASVGVPKRVYHRRDLKAEGS